MAKKMKMTKPQFAVAIVLALVLGAAIGVEYSLLEPQKAAPPSAAPSPVTPSTTNSLKTVPGEHTVELGIPAVDQSGNGVAGRLITTVRPGSGRIFFDIRNVLNREDVQESGRIAAAVAARYAGVDLNMIDVTYVVEVNASQIEGPSAGSSMATAVALALQNKTANATIMMTGTIEEDGTIGTVGAIEQKAAAAREAGAMLFLVPDGQGSAAVVKKNNYCETKMTKDGTPYEFCYVRYDQDKTATSTISGIQVAEVSDLGEALGYYG